jgi:hypothetical protein
MPMSGGLVLANFLVVASASVVGKAPQDPLLLVPGPALHCGCHFRRQVVEFVHGPAGS